MSGPGAGGHGRFGTTLDLVPDDIAIDWSTAEVQALTTARLELHVHLSQEPDGIWSTSFAEATAQHSTSRTLDWGNASVEGAVLAVGDIVHSVDVEKMKEMLLETVADANERARQARQAELDLVLERKKRIEDAEQLARDITERLRRDDTPAV